MPDSVTNLRNTAARYLLTSALILLMTFVLLPRSLAQSEFSAFPATRTQTGASNRASLNAEQVVASMTSRNESRASALHGYSGKRVYHLSYHGLPASKDAELIVEARYSAPSTKEFNVISQSGSKFLVDRVLKPLLANEEEAQSQENRQQSALTPRNYSFELAGEEVTDHGSFYILKVQPKATNRFLYRGEIWVDANDFAIARIEAEPAQNPSFWISHTKIEQRYAKIGPFWLPIRNQSTTKVRLGGTATLVIDYEDYRLSDTTQSKTQAALTEVGRTF